MRQPKFRNIKTTVDGIDFASKAEARRYGELKLLHRAGQITDLQHQPRFPLKVNDQLVCTYVGDFAYKQEGIAVVEDVKSPATRSHPVYRLKNKLLKALTGISIREVS